MRLFKKDNSREIEHLIYLKTQALGRLAQKYIDGDIFLAVMEQRSEEVEKYFDERINKLK